MLQLLPATTSGDSRIDRWTAIAQLYMALVLKAMLRAERNQQIMCEHDMPKLVLSCGADLFKLDSRHPLLSPFHYLLERLACQSLHPRELRRFLRLDKPLCCASLDGGDDDEEQKNGKIVVRQQTEDGGGTLPLHR